MAETAYWFKAEVMWCVLWGEGESGPWLEASILSRLKFPIAAQVQCTLLPHGGAVALESDSAVAGSVLPVQKNAWIQNCDTDFLFL